MKALSPEELSDLRNDIAMLGIPEDHQDVLIRLVDSIIISFVDQAQGLNPVQLSLSSRANYAFNGDSSRANLRNYKKKAIDLLGGEAAIHDDDPTRQAAP